MKLSRKKVLASILAMMLASSSILAGCQNTPAQSEGSPDVSSSDSSKNDDEKKISGDLEIQIFVGGYGEKFWNEQIEGFKSKYSEVNIIKQMGSQINEQMKTRWISGDAPDLVYVDGPEMPQALPQLIADGKIMDLKSFFDTAEDEKGGLIKDNLIDGVLREQNGKIYQAPYIFNTWGMWYDAKQLEDNGVEVPTGFDSFVEAGKQLKEKGIADLCYTGVYANYLVRGTLLAGVASQGGQQIMDDIYDLKEGVFQTEAFKSAVQKIKTLADEGLIMDGCVALNHTDSQMEWLKGSAAFIPNGLWLESEMKDDIPSGFQMRFLPSVLQNEGEKMVLLPDSFGFAVSANTKNPDAALAFLQYLYRDDAAKRFVELTNTPCVYNVDISSLNISEAIKSVQNYLTDPNVTFIAKKASDITPEVETELQNCLNSLIQGNLTVDELCDRVEQAAKLARESAE